MSPLFGPTATLLPTGLMYYIFGAERECAVFFPPPGGGGGVEIGIDFSPMGSRGRILYDHAPDPNKTVGSFYPVHVQISLVW